MIGQTIGEALAGGIAGNGRGGAVVAEGDAEEPALSAAAISKRLSPGSKTKQIQSGERWELYANRDAPSEPAAGPEIEYIVEDGDNPWRIARRLHPDASNSEIQQLADAIVSINEVDAHKIRPGDSLRIPGMTTGEIEEAYQVRSEGTVRVPRNGRQQTITQTEARMMIGVVAGGRLDEFEASVSAASDLANTAFPRGKQEDVPIPAFVREAIARLPAGQRADELKLWRSNDGHNDAMRHALGSALLAAEFGPEWAQQFTTAHEGVNSGSSTREAMDLYNNRVGIQIAIENPGATRERLATLVEQGVRNGRMVVIGSNGHLRWSNQVAYRQHGYTIQLPAVTPKIPYPSGFAPMRP